MTVKNGAVRIFGAITMENKLPTIKVKKIKKGNYTSIKFYNGGYNYSKEDLNSFRGFNLIKDANIKPDDIEEVLARFPDKVVNFIDDDGVRPKRINPYFRKRI